MSNKEYKLHTEIFDFDCRYFGSRLETVIEELQKAHILGINPRRLSCNYIGPLLPAKQVSLRAIDPDRFTIVNESNGEIIEEIEACKAFYEVYDGAVYMYKGRPHLCKKLDLTLRIATVRPAAVKYYTQIRDYTDVHVVGDASAYESQYVVDGKFRRTRARCNNAIVTTRWMGFHRIWCGSGKVFDTVDLFLPDVSFSTQATYLKLPHSVKTKVESLGLPFREGVHGACHAMLNVLPSFVVCNPEDVKTECDNPYNTRYKPERLLLYDSHPGGIGLSSRVKVTFV